MRNNRLRHLAATSLVSLFGTLILAPISLTGQASLPLAEYHIYAGNTHSHSIYTMSHGEQWVKGTHLLVTGSEQGPGKGAVLKPDWQKVQGPPSEHFRRAKAAGYDFYAVTDHSQEAAFQPTSPTNPQWVAAKQQAAEATDGTFVALAGFEHSENNGPGGKGHLNVINSDGMLNALAPGIDLPYLYKWLATAKPNGEGPVVATFNHPGPTQYNNWDYRTPEVTDVITMLEVINGNNKIHYAAFVNALDKGWKVSPVCGLDNHGFTGIPKNTSRTFVLAKHKTKVDILDAMKHRRTYTSLDKNIQCRYTVNGAAMGSTLDRPSAFKFDIAIGDPDTTSPKDKITKIDIVKDHGAVVQEYTPTPGYSVRWTPTVEDSTSKYFFVRVWTAGGGDAPGADPAKPVAWLAPVWTGR
jgi:hypothetical protein